MAPQAVDTELVLSHASYMYLVRSHMVALRGNLSMFVVLLTGYGNSVLY